jgi:SAM-dependent methyltransferase
MDMVEAAALYRLLGEEVRLRMLRLLRSDRLNVTELTGILGIAQSGVSRHLGLLRDGGLLVEEPVGGFTYFRLASSEGGGPIARVRDLLEAQWEGSASSAMVRADEARLQEVLRLRKEDFDAHSTQDGQLMPGRSWAAWARALGHLLPPLKVADLACGEGYLSIEAAGWAQRVVAVDRSAEVLRRARALGKRRRVSNITWKRGELERLPVETSSVDVALLSQALHHAADPARAIAEAARILRPGGRLLLLDLKAHGEQWVRERLGDQWLGFAEHDLDVLLDGAGLCDIRVQVGARKTGDPFTVLLASGRKPGRIRGTEVI